MTKGHVLCLFHLDVQRLKCFSVEWMSSGNHYTYYMGIYYVPDRYILHWPLQPVCLKLLFLFCKKGNWDLARLRNRSTAWGRQGFELRSACHLHQVHSMALPASIFKCSGFNSDLQKKLMSNSNPQNWWGWSYLDKRVFADVGKDLKMRLIILDLEGTLSSMTSIQMTSGR